MKLKVPRGTTDLLPEETATWQYAERILKSLCESYNYQEIRTPHLERTEVLQGDVRDRTDIVQNVMDEFKHKRGRRITLRPEGLPHVVRAYNEHQLYRAAVQRTKRYYFPEMFRSERPQQ